MIYFQFLKQNIQRPTVEGKQRLGQHSKRVAQTVGELVQAAEALKGKTQSQDKNSLNFVDCEEVHATTLSVTCVSKCYFLFNVLKERQNIFEILSNC